MLPIKFLNSYPKYKTLPSDIKLDIIGNTSENIINTIDNLKETIIVILILVVFVVLFFWVVGEPLLSLHWLFRYRWLPPSSI